MTSSTKRKDPNMTEKLASFVLTMRVVENGELVPLVDREVAKNMTAAQICSLVHFDHYPRRVETAIKLGIPPEEYNHPTNLDPLPIIQHRIKTAKVDIPEIAKGDRLSEAQEAFRQRMLSKVGQGEAPDRFKPRKRSWRPPEGFKRSWKTGRLEKIGGEE